MTRHPSSPNAGNRDGTSQADRPQAALDPTYAPVDERSLQDHLAFLQKYACELRYFDARNQPVSDWRGLIGTDPDFLRQASAYAEDPNSVESGQRAPFERPHFALLLCYLKLLRHAQSSLNTITKRHLDFYYLDLLKMTKQAAVPDRVHVLLRPAPRTLEVEVPEGRLLAAGKDRLGRERRYRTDRRIIVNHAQIARRRAVFAERRVTGLREARIADKGTKRDRFMAMLEIALGDPLPGDSLPTYGTGERAREIDYAALLILQGLIEFTATGLFMKLFELREMMQLKQQRDDDEAEWQQINGKLEIMGRARSGDPDFELQPDDPRDFDANLEKALGAVPDFGGLTQVETIDDLYDQRVREDVKTFVRERLFFENFQDFVDMMQVKDLIDNEWAGINRILELAGQEKRGDASYRLPQEDDVDFDPSAFTANLEAAIGPIDFASRGFDDLDAYYAALIELETYFNMSAENFAYVILVAETADFDATSRNWDRVDGILTEVHRSKVFKRRLERLENVRKEATNPPGPFNALIHHVLGEDPAQAAADPLRRLRDYVARDPDFQFLETTQEHLKENPAADVDWDRVIRILEIAQRVREGLPDPVPQIEEWINLHAHPDLTPSSTGADGDTQRWKTFGGAIGRAERENPPAENMGWGIESPLLALSAGQRRIVLTLGFDEGTYDRKKIKDAFEEEGSEENEKGPFQIQVSTEKGWVSPDLLQVRHGDYQTLRDTGQESEQTGSALQLDLTFSEQVDPIVVLGDDETMLDHSWPVLRLMLRQKWQGKEDGEESEKDEYFATDYAAFEHLLLHHVHLKAEVGEPASDEWITGLSDLVAQNDQVELDLKKPFEPFGHSPAVGSRFYLGHPELHGKQLEQLTFRVAWMGVPNDLAQHYANYPTDNRDSPWAFKADIDLIDRHLSVVSKEAELFAKEDAEKPHTIHFPIASENGRADGSTRTSPEPVDGRNLLDWDSYVRWELQPPDFQHQSYPAVAALKAAQLAKALASEDPPPNDIKVDQYVIKPPYTPKIKQLSVAYSASLEIDLSEGRSATDPHRVFHLHPFGYSEVRPETPGDSVRFLPDYPVEGELYLGISDADPPQDLAVLFQMAEGSANPDLEPAPVEWSYLSGDRWISLANGGIKLDTTRGLINSGIIEFELRPAEPSTRLPSDHYWLRAAIRQHSESVCDVIDLHAQAISATFVDNDNASDHYLTPLPKNSIAAFDPRIPSVAEAVQPYTSFGGKPKEEDKIFYTRVSERLRHKQRALTAWDYERLILNRFPEIYKAKCVPADMSRDPDDPGRLKVVVIPDVRGRLPFDPFEPKAPADLLKDIESYLADLTPPFVKVDVVNPHYVTVKIRVGVRFMPGFDHGFYAERLNDDLNRFLSPWAYDEGADIAIGSRIYANSIINFLDGRDYVDFLADIRLFSSNDNGRTFVQAEPTETDGYFVEAERVDGVLVAARKHELDFIVDEVFDEDAFAGINYMKIELDFKIGPNSGADTPG